MEKWKSILCDAKNIDVDALQLDKIEIDDQSGVARLEFCSQKLVWPEDVKVVGELFSAALSPAKATARIRWKSPAPTQGLVLEYVRRLMLSSQPGFRPYMDRIELSLDGARIEARLPNGSNLIWQAANMSQLIETALGHVFCAGYTVVCAQDTDAPALDIVDIARPVPIARPSQGQEGAVAKKRVLFGVPPKSYSLESVDSITIETGKVSFEGRVLNFELKEIKGGMDALFLFDVTDFSDSIGCKIYLSGQKNGGKAPSSPAAKALREGLAPGTSVRIHGKAQEDTYNKVKTELKINVDCVERAEEKGEGGAARLDDCDQKRVELHLHTQMSTMDSTASIEQAVKRAAKWGQEAVAVTDHGVVQAYPEFYSAAKAAGIKAIYGMEGYLVDDCQPIPYQKEYVVFDVETTGKNPKHDQLIQLAAVRIINGQLADSFNEFINPAIPIPEEIVKLTGITDKLVSNADDAEGVLTRFKAFAGESVLVAHNAIFDMTAVTTKGAIYGIQFNNPSLDTLTLSRYLLRNLKHHRLSDVVEHFGVVNDHAHQADADTQATAQVFLKLLELYKSTGATELPAVLPRHRLREKKQSANHIVLLVQDQTGLENMYKLVTYAHLNHFSYTPRIPRSLLMVHRQGLILGSACESGELFKAVLSKDKDRAEEIARFYDYLEIQPIGNNEFLVREGKVENDEGLRRLNGEIVALADKLGKPCVATCDVHFIEPRDECFRRILLSSKKFADADFQPPLFMRTTGEMLEEFAYLGPEKAREVVVENTRAIAGRCQMLKPFPFETCQPIIEGAQEELVECVYQKAHQLYGQQLPENVTKRVEHELNSIIKHGFSSLYITARKLVLKSNSDGYLVGSRGSVGSSVVAFLSGITEVNALEPHYVCPNCKHSRFDVDTVKYSCGCDMPDQDCPVCGTRYKKDGYTIPFETFLGFDGDKVPDIDLNFSGDYQPQAHKYTEVLFGEGNVFRAGTISGVQAKTAYGYVLKYMEEHGRNPRRAELDRLAQGCCGVKRTTGQHPGGIVVVPEERSVFEFTPLQHPADEPHSNIVTTHFDFTSMHDTLVKLDILGHDDPTVIRMLQSLTGLDPKTIPLDDPDTMSLFSSVTALDVSEKELGSKVGTYGVPEFGTGFVRQILVETRPSTMEELVRIAGLSHGTDVWTNNAEELVKSGVATLNQVICTRDDIMNYLIQCGVEKKMAFTIMEKVRKGKGLDEKMEQAMIEKNVAKWYINSCKLIKYMFPRAHAAAYVMMSFRVAYYKVHYPLAYYCAYYTVRADAFSIESALGGADAVMRHMKRITALGNDAKQKDKDMYTVLEVVLEMYLRGFELENVDLERSKATEFVISGEKTLLPPFNSIDGLGDKAAKALEEGRAGGKYYSCEDIQRRAGVGKATTDALRQAGCLGDMPETDQITFF